MLRDARALRARFAASHRPQTVWVMRRSSATWRQIIQIIGLMGAFAGTATSHALLGADRREMPIPAEKAVSQFQLHPDLAIELVAAEPDVIDPVDMAFDPDGRLWVVEMSDYPNGPGEGEPARSRIRILTDDDGDGHYEAATTFADQLLFATGLLLWRDGALVTVDGDLMLLSDRNGDGRADHQESWFTGFKQENPQLRANHPTLGLDNRIYVASGLRGGDVRLTRADWPARDAPVSLANFDFVFDPHTGEYGVTTGVGQFGQCFDDWGNRFVCSNRNPCKHIVLEDRYLSANPHLRIPQVHEDISPAGEASKLFPISRTWTTSNLHANQFTAACGVLIYRGAALPREFQGNSFTCEPTGNLVHRDVLSPRGATFKSRPGREGVEFLATKDEWFRPVNLQHGPDGALYVVDMHRAVIEHPQFMPDELKTRSDLTFGNDCGRIYRIVPRRRDPRLSIRQLRLSTADNDTLISHLNSPNVWLRETAARLLLERHDSTTAPRLRAVVRDSRLPQSRVRALWLLDGLQQLPKDLVLDGLNDEDPRVREQAARLADLRFSDDETLRDRIAALLCDPASDDWLLFQCVQSLGRFPLTEEHVQSIAATATRFADDEWFRWAVASSVGNSMPLVLRTVLDSVHNGSLGPDDLITLAQQYAELVGTRRNDDEMQNVLQSAVRLAAAQDLKTTARNRLLWALLRGLARGLRGGESLPSLATHLDPPERQVLDDVFGAVVATSLNSRMEGRLRREAVETLAFLDATTARSTLLQIVERETDQELVTASIQALSRSMNDGTAERLLSRFRSATPVHQRAVLGAVLSSVAGTAALIEHLEQGSISPRDIDLDTSGRLRKHRDPDIRERAEHLFGSLTSEDRLQVLQQFEPALTLQGDTANGRTLFAKTCATCHQIGEIGVNVAPDISDSRVKTRAQILTDILDPNRAIDSNYFGYTILDTSGRVHTGVVSAETPSSVTLRQPEGKTVTVLREEIEQMSSTGQSLMPVGLEKDITPQQMADLIAFIKNWRYLDGQVPAEVIR